MLKKILIFIIFLTGIKVSLAQTEINVRASIDTAKMMIGDQVKLKLEAEQSGNVKIKWPFIPDTLGKIEVLERSKIDTLKEQGRTLLRQTLNITAFDSGYYAIKPFQFNYTKGNDTSNFIAETQALLLSVYAPKVDTTKAIKDIKQPLDVPFTFREALPYIIGFILLAGLFWLIYYFYQKKKKGQKIFEPVITARPVHEIAMEELKNLEAEKIWQQGNFKVYHSRLSDIVRIYIEGRFGISAMELTSDEIIESFRGNIISAELKEELKQLLKLADLVKFAKAQPLPNENDLSIKNAYAFVEGTILQKGSESAIVEEKNNNVE